MIVKQGQIYNCTLDSVVGSEQGGMRPVLIIQNDVGNKHSPTTIVAMMTSRMNKVNFPMHTEVSHGLPKTSVVLCEQLRTIDKKRLGNLICELSVEEMQRVKKCLKISFSL